MVFWTIGILGTVAGIAGLAFLFVSIRDLTGQIQKAMINLFTAAGTYILHQSLSVIFGWYGLPMTHPFWYLVPILYFVAAIPFTISMHELYHIARDLRDGDAE